MAKGKITENKAAKKPVLKAGKKSMGKVVIPPARICQTKVHENSPVSMQGPLTPSKRMSFLSLAVSSAGTLRTPEKVVNGDYPYYALRLVPSQLLETWKDVFCESVRGMPKIELIEHRIPTYNNAIPRVAKPVLYTAEEVQSNEGFKGWPHYFVGHRSRRVNRAGICLYHPLVRDLYHQYRTGFALHSTIGR